MIVIKNEVIREQKNFWNNCIFHPTDAVEDPWGKRILDRMADDKSIDTVRIYAMLEDIVYLGEEGEIRYDFRVSDLRLDYLVEKGYNVLIAYGGIPDCIAVSSDNKTSMSKGKTRYKGKLWNSMPPKDYKVWEEICYQYTKHLVDRYGIDVVSKWYVHCFNEPDLPRFMLAHLDNTAYKERLDVYCPMYEGFVKGVLRADDRLHVGGPALAFSLDFLKGFLNYVKERNLRLDYIAVHNYGTDPFKLREGRDKIDAEHNIENHLKHLETIKACGFEDCELVIDEWGMCTRGFWNSEECPELIVREHEVFSAYYTKLLRRFIDVDPMLSKLMICLSGQHEMTEDFSGFRNFFTLNHFAKPIYNAHLMASKLKNLLLRSECASDNIFVIPTRDESGAYSVMLSYCSEHFEEDIPTIEEELSFEDSLSGKRLTVYCIDKETTNPYRLAEKLGVRYPNDEEKKLLREEGRMKPIIDTEYGGEPVKLKLTPNSTYLVKVV